MIRELQKDNTASFHFIEGGVECGPGPGIEGIFEGPYYSFYKWPRTFEDDDKSLNDSYEYLSDVIEDEGPFDGIIGFSHGGTLAFSYLAHLAKVRPHDALPFRCAVFMNSPPPFRMDLYGNLIVEEGLQNLILIPTLHVVGKKDFIYNLSVELHELCGSSNSTLLLHDKGHQIPSDTKNVNRITKALRELCQISAFL